MVAERTSRELVEACKLGDRDAFAELFELHKDRVYSIALRYTGNATAATDLAQDVFLKLFSRIGEYRAESSVETWIYRMVVNACIDHYRRNRRWLPELFETVVASFRSPERAVLDDLIADQEGEAVRKAVAALPPDQRMTVVLRYTENLSYDEIAETMDCSPGTVASRLNRAHKALERRLQATTTRR